MKLQNVPLDQIVWNPWRDKTLFPIDDEHVAGLRASITEHGFFQTLKGRRRGGKVELGCGHSRFEAAKLRPKLDSIPIYVDDIDDDQMLRLMTDENALQAGGNPGAVMNEVAAVTRRLIEGLEISPTIVGDVVKAFESKQAIESARSKIRAGNAHLALGEAVIRRYLGEGDPDKSPRPARAIREAIGALKQSGRYDDLVEEMRLRHSVASKHSNDTAVIPKEFKFRRRILDERTANLFPNDHQFHAFREAVTTFSAQAVIPVSEQYALAKQIMDPKNREGFSKKQVGAPYIKKMVQVRVQEGMKKQRDIDKAEQERYLMEQIDEQIDSELHSASASLRSLISAIMKLEKLADKYPAHPKLGGFSAKLDTLVNAIKQFSRKLK
jgi:hypothetical protein